MDMIGRIRRLHSRGKKSEREISRMTGLSRNTIAKWLKAPLDGGPKYRRGEQPGKLTAFHEVLKQALKADAHRPKHERRTARALYSELKSAGYEGGYAFLSQMFDYGNTAIEKRSIFFKRLLPLLEFGREREGVDLSKVTLTHHKLKRQGISPLTLGEAEGDHKLDPMTEPGTGQVQDKEKIKLSEIVQKVNDLFEGELTEGDKLVYVNNVLMGKLLESDLLMQQAANNSKEQFANSPDLSSELMNAIMDAFEAHSTMSKQAIDSDKVRQGLKHILLGPAELYEALSPGGHPNSPTHGHLKLPHLS